MEPTAAASDRPRRDDDHHDGLSIFLRSVFQYFIGGGNYSYSQYTTADPWEIGPVLVSPAEVAVSVVGLVVLVLASLTLQRTRLGKATRAVADNPALAAASGINVDRVIRLVWIGGAALAGLSGVGLGLTQGFNYQFGLKILLLIFAAVVLGGLGTIWGALAPSLIIGILIEVSTIVVPTAAEVRQRTRRAHHRPRLPSARHPRPSRAGRLRPGRNEWTGPRCSGSRCSRALDQPRSCTAWRPSGSTCTSATPGCSTSVRPASWPWPPTAWPPSSTHGGCRSGSASPSGCCSASCWRSCSEIPTLRLRADYLAIVTIAAAEIIRQTVGSVSLLEYFGGQDGLQQFTSSFSSLNPYSSRVGIEGVVTWRAYDFWVMTVGWILVALCCLVVYLLMRSPWGRVLKGIREDEDAVRSLGKNVYAYKMQSLIIGGLFGALAGFIIALRSAAINPSFFATDVTFFAYTVLLIGGAARVLGPVVGAVIFWFLITFLDVFFSQATASNLIPDAIMTTNQASLIRFMFMGLALMLLMIYRPQGIFGDRKELALDARSTIPHPSPRSGRSSRSTSPPTAPPSPMRRVSPGHPSRTPSWWPTTYAAPSADSPPSTSSTSRSSEV